MVETRTRRSGQWRASGIVEEGTNARDSRRVVLSKSDDLILASNEIFFDYCFYQSSPSLISSSEGAKDKADNTISLHSSKEYFFFTSLSTLKKMNKYNHPCVYILIRYVYPL